MISTQRARAGSPTSPLPPPIRTSIGVDLPRRLVQHLIEQHQRTRIDRCNESLWWTDPPSASPNQYARLDHAFAPAMSPVLVAEAVKAARSWLQYATGQNVYS